MKKLNNFLQIILALVITSLTASPSTAATPTGVNPAVDMTLPNFANSPNLRKFVDSLPGLGIANKNNLGQYIPVANPDNNTYPGSDYYEIGLKQYQQRMHSDLPAPGTKLRGYYQINAGTVGTTDNASQYLGPLIIAKRDRPTRIKFLNQLGINGAGDLLVPVDTTVMGAGLGPQGQMYTQNRANLHLHGGFTPWISDGTPHQWITPAGDATQYKKGVSFQNVPDMYNGSGIPCIGGTTCFTPAQGDGIGTYYYPNQQSARLLFYHDHAYGITRLNVYAGEAAGYLLTDQVEEDLISGTNLSGVFGTATPAKILPDLGIPEYRYGIPLIIQDKSFVNDASTPPNSTFAATNGTPTPTTLSVDPLWYTHEPGTTGGDLWFPHEYLPNENIYDPNGYWYMGRWDYGPWILPPMLALNNTLPTPSIVPEAFMDTPVVNGTAFPYLELPPTAVRFRILNACNDRMLNLQLYKADSLNPTEVKMVPASRNPAFPTWPRDGRDGGVPDPTTAGPDMIQIGNESGFLAKAAVIPAQPVDFDYDRTSATFGNVASTALYLPPAVRADVVVDLSTYNDGDTLILYNDAPAPMPLFDDRYDYFTGSLDWSPKGGAPTPQIGFGPNTRTIMQIRIKGTATSTFSQAALQAILPKAFAKSQDAPLVPASAYNEAYGTAYLDNFAGVADYTLNVSGSVQPVTRVFTELPGFGYTTPPAVSFFGGGGSGAAATATLNGITGVTLLASGSGCTTPPAVSFTPAAGNTGTGATATAIISGGVVTAVAITNPGSNYLVAPTVTFSGGCTVAPAATAIVTLGSVGTINLTNPGSGYTKAPYVFLTGGGGTGAAAVAMLNGAMVLHGKNLVEGMDMEYGRMNAVLGSIPSPLAPEVGAGPFIGANFYVDPPTEVLKAGETSLWRISHLGVDSHAIHFHLFEVQVINRVDWTNTLKPPYDEEIGWKETIRTNPFEDIIVALRPKAMNLPFAIPDSNRLLAPASPAGSTEPFQPALPPPGIPAVAQTTNIMTNFGWEYVWHCHLLGHEENDMMRPIVFNPGTPVATVAPASLNFGSLPVNTPSPALNVNLSDTGLADTQSLIITSIAITGTHAGDFSRTSTCGSSLAPGTNCTISVTFTPSAAGVRTASLVIVSNDPARPTITVALTGAGIPTGLATDAIVFTDRGTSAAAITSPTFTTSAPNELLLAFISADVATATGTNSAVTGVTNTGGALTWSLVRRTNTQRGTAEIWRAFAPATKTGTVTATFNMSVPASSITVVSYSGVDTTGTNGSGAIGATASGSAASGAPTATLTTTRNNSLVFGVGIDWDRAIARTLGPNQSMVHQYLAPVGDTYWVQRQNSAIPLAGTPVTINDTAPTTDRYNLSIVEIRSPGLAGPAVANVSPAALTFASQTLATTSPAQTVTLSNTGGALLTINSIGLTGTNAADFIQSGTCGANLAAGTSCTINVSFRPTIVGARAATLAISSSDTVNPLLSVPLTGTGTLAPTGLAIDTTVSTDRGTATTAITTPSFTTSAPNELLLAFVSADVSTASGTNSAVTGITNTGGALTWTLVRRTNTQRGTAEVWRAFATAAQTGTVTATFNMSVPAASITVVSFSGVDTTGTNGSGAIGATASGSAAAGAPTATLTTTRNNSWVFGVGIDWDNAIPRTPGPNQTLVHQYLAPVNDTYWVQRQNSTTPLAGTAVTINDTAPTTDRYNLTIIEVRTP